ncbi:glycosyltransferase family 32 protein [uncultured Bacteroides sp.]|uniref:glycosyltransferase family 32 protein n=1 Tax=uncultured Bacteroides sp. TaxID=162156 RepID=UPI0025E11BF4|nr:glycosyltransferase [uncultured Bacteroides sp.]
MIPKLIHYCWLSGDAIPEKLQRCMDSWKKHLPDYEFVLWDLNRFDIRRSLWVQQAFEARKYAFAADYIRLYAVYHYGGIYMDMDVEVLRSFDTLLDADYMFGLETEEGVEAGIFGAKPYNPYIKKCLDYYEGRTFRKADGSYDMRPLPAVMYGILSGNYTILPRATVSLGSGLDAMSLFPVDYFTAKSYETGKVKVTKNTYTIHHFAGSWVSPVDKIKERIYKWISKNVFLAWIYDNTYKRIKRLCLD